MRFAQECTGSQMQVKKAACDAGHLLKALIKDDKQSFRTKTDQRGYRWYQWDGKADANTLKEVQQYHPYINLAKQQLESKADSFIKAYEKKTKRHPASPYRTP